MFFLSLLALQIRYMRAKNGRYAASPIITKATTKIAGCPFILAVSAVRALNVFSPTIFDVAWPMFNKKLKIRI